MNAPMTESTAEAAPAKSGSKICPLTVTSWFAQLVAALILVLGAMPKFTTPLSELPLTSGETSLPGPAQFVYVIGALEILAIILLVIPKTIVYGAIIAAALMLGALISHVAFLGFEGMMLQLAIMALVAFAASLTVLVLRRKNLPFLKSPA